jgi:hypothetical protein
MINESTLPNVPTINRNIEPYRTRYGSTPKTDTDAGAGVGVVCELMVISSSNQIRNIISY